LRAQCPGDGAVALPNWRTVTTPTELQMMVAGGLQQASCERSAVSGPDVEE